MLFLTSMILEKRIPYSYIFNEIKWDILFVTVFAIAINIADIYLKRFDELKLSVPISLAALLGTAISLVLSFKLAQSYDRWWEARKIWGAIVNDSRSLVIQLKNFTKKSKNQIIEPLARRVAYRQIAWCYSLSKSLRKLDPVEDIYRLIDEKEIDKIKSHFNVPLALVDLSEADLKELYDKKKLTDFQRIQVDDTFVRLVASMGKAERIKNTVFPKTYRVYLQCFIYVFLTALGIALTGLHSLIEIPIMIFVSLPFFLLEKTAWHMQDPFENRPTDTAMLAISRAIEINIKQTLEDEVDVEPYAEEKFYIM